MPDLNLSCEIIDTVSAMLMCTFEQVTLIYNYHPAESSPLRNNVIHNAAFKWDPLAHIFNTESQIHDI